ncbi:MULTISPECIES: hypothetical protein [Streptomyces]|uniref:hypothetical protein n=1 Tax=Streptomyces TaxID=1883 RepID=UPI000A372310|nr:MULTISPECIES: hypothetical protein [Streptomyces]QTI90739.1 hypothetical protein AS97_44635 [Streptomyces sp. AgN23]RSS39739.1 hypothetical protein EF902_26760 [Streptomyces sp. WAC05858]WTA86983.1 hypothetical protein OG751_09930 [Streptomyces antimycoticus]WTB11786.1 hypothetical protein OG546_38565 [Streptomyces antimycoticus]
MAPVPRDSGRRTGNYHRPKRYSRRLRHVLQTSMAWTATTPTARRLSDAATSAMQRRKAVALTSVLYSCGYPHEYNTDSGTTSPRW